MDVDYADLSLASQVLARQDNPHLVAMRRYIDTHCRLSPGDLGLILRVLHPINESAVDVGQGVLNVLGGIYRAGAERLDQTIELYAQADRDTHQQISSLFEQLGLPAPAFTDPLSSLPLLGTAASGADSDYSKQPGDPAGQLLDITASEANALVERPARAFQRAGAVVESNPAVCEAQDVSSYLVTPQLPDSPVQDLRWTAGVLLGSLDWVFEMIAGYSLLEEVIMKPFAGDWDRIGGASIAWTHVDDALVAVGSNTTALVRSTASWTGAGSVAFLSSATIVAAAATGLSYAAAAMSSCLALIESVSQRIAKQIGQVLKAISNRLIRIAAESSIPIAGWLAAAIEVTSLMNDVLSDVRRITNLIEKLFEAVEEAVRGRDKLDEVRYQVVDIIEGLGRTTMARVA